MTRVKSLHHNLGEQDPLEGGKNVVFHHQHRSKKGKKMSPCFKIYEFMRYKLKKDKKIIRKVEKGEDFLA
jgi:hypothetical protein